MEVHLKMANPFWPRFWMGNMYCKTKMEVFLGCRLIIFRKSLCVYTFIKKFERKFFDNMAKHIRSKNLIENKEKYGLIWFDLESISRPIDKLRVKAKTLCENQLTEIKTEQPATRQVAFLKSQLEITNRDRFDEKSDDIKIRTTIILFF